jgi:hypothetical protein
VELLRVELPVIFCEFELTLGTFRVVLSGTMKGPLQALIMGDFDGEILLLKCARFGWKAPEFEDNCWWGIV